MLPNEIGSFASRLKSFSAEASEILGSIESSKTRKITLDESYKKLQSISLKQDDLFRQSLRCVEVGVYRAAHVMAWAAFIDCLQTLVASDSFKAINLAYPDWKVASLDAFRENKTEFSLIDALHKINIIRKSEEKALHGMLSKRNECAHPADYFPSFNETLGYITEIFSRLDAIEKRYPHFILA